MSHLTRPFLLHTLLKYLSYADVLALLGTSKAVRHALTEIRDLKEEVLERFLRGVGYGRWVWGGTEGLALSLKVRDRFLFFTTTF